MSLGWWGLVALASVSLVGCERPSPEPEPAPLDAPRSPRVNPVQAEPEPEPRVQAQDMIGVLAPEAEVVLVASGFARLERLDFKVGDRVAAGELVAVMDVRGDRSELASVTAAWRAAQAELEGLELELQSARAKRADIEGLEDFVSKAELREQRFAEALADARKRSAGASLSQQRSKMQAASERVAEAELRAPFAGFVAQRYADPGATLGAGDPVVTLVSEARLIRFAVPEAMAGALTLGAPLQVRFPDHGFVLRATVSAIAPEIEAGTRLLLAEAALADPPALRVGAVARLRFVDR